MDKVKQKAKIGIKIKLLGVLLPVVIAVISAIIGLVYVNISGMMLQKSEELLTTSTQSTINDIKAWMNETITALNVERDTIEYFDMDKERELDYIKHTVSQYDAFPAGIYLATTAGELIHASFVPGSDYNVFEKPWYKDGLESEEFMFGSVYFDEDSQAYVVGASGKLLDSQGEARGVAAADIYLDAISKIVGEVQIEESGGMILVDTITGTIIGHRDSSFLGTPLADHKEEMYTYIDSQIQADAKGIFTFTDSSESRSYLDIENVPNSSWVSISYVPYNEILAELLDFTKLVVTLAVVGILILIVLMERFIHIIVKPVKKLSSTIAAVTYGDFTADVDVKTKDEIGIMADGLRNFIETMRSIILEITSISKTLGEQSMEGFERSGNLSKSAEMQATSMVDMTSTINELAQSITDIAQSATKLSGLVADTSRTGDSAQAQIRDAVETSAAGKEDMSKVTGYMHDISVKMNSLEASAEQMDESISKINSIVILIGDIAEETNLLSLNASIEAARAGEFGRGFAVVADQIGKLATTSKEAVGDIANLTGEIKNLVSRTVEETRDSAETIRSSSSAVNQAENSFQLIYDAVGQTNEAVTTMLEVVKEVSEISVNMAGITEEQSAVSQEILATTETIRENAKNVDHDSQMMLKDSKQLEKNAKELSQQMSQFKL